MAVHPPTNSEVVAATLPPPRLLASGDSAITVEFSRNIDDEANRRVLALDQTLAREAIAGITETVPTYRSLLVHYDPVQIGFDALGEKLIELAQLPVPERSGARRWRIPVAYGGEHGIDLEEVAKTLNTTPDDIVARHTAGNYRVAMIGFTPGWSYLSGLEDSLHMPRRQNPRLLTPAGTISIGGVQTGVQCLAGPSGWHLLGAHGGAHLSAASRTDFPAGARRCRDVLSGRRHDIRRTGSRRGSRRDRSRVDRVMSRLVITAIGPASSVQDGGRYGSQRYGLTPSGAMDRLALAAANCLLGNAPFTAAVEVGPLNAVFTARDGAVRIALTGAARNADIAGRAVAFNTSATLADGESLTLGFARDGVFSYLAIEGGVQGEPMFGSLAVNARAGLGSPYPRPLQSGDELQVAAASGAPRRRIDLPAIADAPIRVVMGPQDDEFSEEKQGAVSRQRMEDIRDQRPHGLSSRRARHQASAWAQHRLRRHCEWQHPGARQRRADRTDAGSRHQRRLPQDRDGHHGGHWPVCPDFGGPRFSFQGRRMAEAQAEARKFSELLRTLPDRVRDIENFELNLEALQNANVAGAAVNAFDARTWQTQLPAETRAQD